VRMSERSVEVRSEHVEHAVEAGDEARTPWRVRFGRNRPDLLPVAIIKRAQGLVEGTFEPGKVVGLAVVVGDEVVGATGRGVANVVEPAADEAADVAESLGVSHRPRPGAGHEDGRSMGEHSAGPFVEVSLGPEGSRRDPSMALHTDLFGKGQARIASAGFPVCRSMIAFASSRS